MPISTMRSTAPSRARGLHVDERDGKLDPARLGIESFDHADGLDANEVRDSGVVTARSGKQPHPSVRLFMSLLGLARPPTSWRAGWESRAWRRLPVGRIGREFDLELDPVVEIVVHVELGEVVLASVDVDGGGAGDRDADRLACDRGSPGRRWPRTPSRPSTWRSRGRSPWRTSRCRAARAPLGARTRMWCISQNLPCFIAATAARAADSP